MELGLNSNQHFISGTGYTTCFKGVSGVTPSQEAVLEPQQHWVTFVHSPDFPFLEKVVEWMIGI